MGEGRGKGGVGRGKGRGSTRLLGVLPAARRRQVLGVHRTIAWPARALEEVRRLRHAAAHAGPLLGRGFGRGCGAAAVVAEEAAEDAVGRRGAGPPTGARRDIRSWMARRRRQWCVHQLFAGRFQGNDRAYQKRRVGVKTTPSRRCMNGAKGEWVGGARGQRMRSKNANGSATRRAANAVLESASANVVRKE